MLRRLYGYERLFCDYYQKPRPYRIQAKGKTTRNKSALNRYLIKQHDIGLTNLLFYGDIVAMMNSIENRSPFMDHRLVDLVFSKGDRLKIVGSQNKYALRTSPVFEDFRDVLERKKIGFSSDVKTDTKRQMIRELTESPILTWPIFSKRFSTFLNGNGFEDKKYERLLFRVYQVHLWNEVFQEAKDSSRRMSDIARASSPTVCRRTRACDPAINFSAYSN